MTQADSVLSTPPTNTSATRRNVLSMIGAAAIMPTSIEGALAQPVDPIFAAIERHRSTYRAWMDSFGDDEIEAAVPEELRRSSMVGAIYGEPDWLVPGDDPAWIAYIETAVRTSTEHGESAIALVSFDSLTVAGAVALLQYVASVEARDPETWPDDLVDGDGKRQSWHYFLMESLEKALSEASV